MKSRWISAFSLIVLPIAMISVYAADVSFQKGENWVYEVKGSKPWTTDSIYGDRTITIDIVGKDGWMAKEMWGRFDESPYEYTISRTGMVNLMKVGNDISIAYTTPIPFQLLDVLKVDEEKDYGVFKMDRDEFSMSLSTIVKRKADEDVTVPAGEFKGAQQYVITTRLVLKGNEAERTRVMTRKTWVHKDVNGIVKESYEFQPFGADSDDEKETCETALKSHEIKAE